MFLKYKVDQSRQVITVEVAYSNRPSLIRMPI
jgi:hypothetical protein